MISLELKSEKDLPDFDDVLSRFVVHAAQKIRQRFRERMTEPKTGRLYRRKRGDGFTRFHRASAPGESPATDTGAYARSMTVTKRAALESAIETNLGYPEILESRKNRPMWKVTVDEMMPVLENDLARMMV